ncbi:hypothetical protein PCANC_17147 [Puccinia coronata f. sp. avenae]|uniref:Uncharacterized protein n=2 Tax=Puccinia coronata f. sp. avenae TaxID=200324 RepID=A0A2N5UIX9_9BASI|nr:hypothetical protein PCANC_17147 [Puccinia coronata f. sp. avenae]
MLIDFEDPQRASAPVGLLRLASQKSLNQREILPSQPVQGDRSRHLLWVIKVGQHPALRDKLAALMLEAFTAVLLSTLQESQNRKAATNPERAGEGRNYRQHRGVLTLRPRDRSRRWGGTKQLVQGRDRGPPVTTPVTGASRWRTRSAPETRGGGGASCDQAGTAATSGRALCWEIVPLCTAGKRKASAGVGPSRRGAGGGAKMRDAAGGLGSIVSLWLTLTSNLFLTAGLQAYTLRMVPQRIWLAFNGYLVSVRTNTLEIVQDLMLAAKNGFPISLRDVEPPSITLHTTEHAEALDSGLALAEIAAQLTPCAARETPLIVKVNGIPTIIWLSFKDDLVSVQTKGLMFVDGLACEVQKRFPGSLGDMDTPRITLHTTEHAEALGSGLALAEIAAQLTPCAARETPLIVKVNGLPTRIWLSFNGHLVGIRTNKLEFVEDLVYGAKNGFPISLRDVEPPSITLHTTEHAEALDSGLAIAKIAAQLTPCAARETPLIVKAKGNIEEENILRFWKNLPEATLVADGEMPYLELKESYVLGNPNLGHRFIVRPIYKELCARMDTKGSGQWVVTGTPGIGKTIFSAYYLWTAACKNKTVLWEPFQTPGRPVRTYLMTSSGVELLADNSDKLANARANSETLYIVDGRAPQQCQAWTLLVTSPQRTHYKDILKESSSSLLYMPPWSYEELEFCKAVLYPDERVLPTTLMRRLFEWYGGVPRFVVARAKDQLEKLGGDEEAALEQLVDDLTQAIKQTSMREIIDSHRFRSRDGEYSHRVLHLCRVPKKSLNHFQLEWASSQVENFVLSAFEEEIQSDQAFFLKKSKDYDAGNLRGIIFEMYAHAALRDGGTFQARRLDCDPPSDQSVEVTFPAAERQYFRGYEEVDLLRTDVLWQPTSKNLASIDSLRGPANLFQVTVSEQHAIKHQGLMKALGAVNKAQYQLSPRLYFVVPSDRYFTYKRQPYLKADGKVYTDRLGDVGKVEQWALMIPTGSERPATVKDGEHHAGTKRKAD